MIGFRLALAMVAFWATLVVGATAAADGCPSSNASVEILAPLEGFVVAPASDVEYKAAVNGFSNSSEAAAYSWEVRSWIGAVELEVIYGEGSYFRTALPNPGNQNASVTVRVRAFYPGGAQVCASPDVESSVHGTVGANEPLKVSVFAIPGALGGGTEDDYTNLTWFVDGFAGGEPPFGRGVAPISWSIDYGDGTGPGHPAGSYHTYPGPGNYTIRIFAEDAIGQYSNATKTITIVRPPEDAPSQLPLMILIAGITAVGFPGGLMLIRRNRA